MPTWGKTQILRVRPKCYRTLTHKMKVQVTSQDRSPKIVSITWIIIWIPPDSNRRSFFVFSECTLVLYGAWLPWHICLWHVWVLRSAILCFCHWVFICNMTKHVTTLQRWSNELIYSICFEKIKRSNNAWNYQFTFKIIFNSL